MRETPRRIARLRQIACLVAVIAATGGTVAALSPPNPKQGRTTAQAIRIDLKPKSVAYTVGTKPDLVLTLVDPKGAPVKAPKDFAILVEALSADGKVVHRETIPSREARASELT